MLVDEEDNIWLIDFGCGLTDGWVDDENMETKSRRLAAPRFEERNGQCQGDILMRRL
jgi:hypothetical protein